MPIPPKPTVSGDNNAWGGKLNTYLDSLTPKTDGKIVKNVGGTLVEVAVADEVAAAPAVAANTTALGRVAPSNDPGTGLQLRKGFDGTLQWLRGPHINLADVLDPVASDHSAALRSLWDTNGDGYGYFLPPGMDLKIPIKNYTQSLPPRLRSHMRIVGAGPSSRILITGFAGASKDDPAYAGIVHTHYDNTGPVEDVTIENLAIVGDGPGASQTWTNNQAAAVRFAPDAANPIMRTLFRRVLFLNIDGFPLHSDGSNDRYTTTEHCHVENCGNGVNMNGDFYSGIEDTFKNSEGYECAGAGLLIAGPIFEDIFSVAVSAGGNFSQSPNQKALPSARIVYAQVFGVRGGTGLGAGNGIILAQSLPDALVGFCYVERTFGNGYQSSHTSTTGPDDGATFIGDHAVNCGAPGGGNTGFYLIGNKNKLLGARSYNRVANTADPYPLGVYRSLYGAIIQGADCLIDGSGLDMSNGGNYALQLAATATGTRLGTNALTGGALGLMTMTTGATIVDASRIAETFRDATAAFTAKIGDRNLWSIPTTAAKNINLFSAKGLTGYRLTCRNRGNGTWPVTVTPSGTEKINGVNAPISLVSANAAVTLLSDGTDWWIESGYGTVS